jgi:hypothetical protein
MKTTFYSLVLIGILLTASRTFAWDNICELGSKALSFTSAQLPDFNKDNVKGRLVEGKGYVLNAWEYGINKYYTVKIDCGNDVIILLTTLSRYTEIKPGQIVSFEGHGSTINRKLYVDSGNPYVSIELDRGSIK